MEFKYDFVMLVDDVRIDNFINQTLIEKCRFSKEVFVYHLASEALDYLNIAASLDNNSNFEPFPELIILDLNMPVIDGFSFLEQFEQIDEHFRSGTKIVILTTSDRKEDRERAMSYSFVSNYLLKPLLADHLEQI